MMGRARATHVSSPPTITVSLPASAPATPPLTGASTNPTLLAPSRLASSREVNGSPEVASINNCPARQAPPAASATPQTSRDVGRQVMTTSTCFTRAPGESATRTPVACANSRARAAVRFQTTVSNRPATCLAIGRPIAPNPINPTRSAITLRAFASSTAPPSAASSRPSPGRRSAPPHDPAQNPGPPPQVRDAFLGRSRAEPALDRVQQLSVRFAGENHAGMHAVQLQVQQRVVLLVDGADDPLAAPLHHRAQESDERLRCPARQCLMQHPLLERLGHPGGVQRQPNPLVGLYRARHGLKHRSEPLGLTAPFPGLEQRLGVVARDGGFSH